MAREAVLATGERNSMVGRVIWTETDEESMAFCQSRPTSPKMSDLPLWALRGVGKSWESATTLGTPKAKAGSTHPLCRRQAPTCSLTEPPVLGMLSNSFVQSLSRVQLFCDPIDYSPPISSVHGISQARIVEWVAISFFRGSSWTRDQTHISCIGRWILYHWATREAPTELRTRILI